MFPRNRRHQGVTHSNFLDPFRPPQNEQSEVLKSLVEQAEEIESPQRLTGKTGKLTLTLKP